MTSTGGESLIVGLSLPPDPSRDHVGALLDASRKDGFDFITTSLPQSLEALRPDVTAVEGKWWRTSVVGVISESPISESFRKHVPLQMEWASHMGIPVVVFPPPPDSDAFYDYAQTILSLGLKHCASNNIQIWIQTPMTREDIQKFDILYKLCNGMTGLGMLLQFVRLPANPSREANLASSMALLHHAIGSQLKGISIPTQIFLSNKMGFPTLGKPHQLLFNEALKRVGRTVRVLLDGPGIHLIESKGASTNPMGETKCLPYVQYIRHLRSADKIADVLDKEDARMETPYLDNLQRPLEPLRDHLEFSIYETFEKDPVKYARYQEAIASALKDIATGVGGGIPRVVIAVAGSGRGPLVTRAIRAYQQVRQIAPALMVDIYAIEKNPSAVIYLRNKAQSDPEWKALVKIVHADIRAVHPGLLGGNQIDIIVSELLGSFGDNELSPECLDPLITSTCCKPTTVSIPMEYTTAIAPVTSMKLHEEARIQAQIPGDGNQPIGLQRAMETPYVVRTHAASQTHMEQNCWSFRHPCLDPQNKERTATIEFLPDPTLAVACGSGYGPIDAGVSGIMGHLPASRGIPLTLHGLLGSFTAVLYAGENHQGTDISIAPHRFSKGMFSWFPLYFPFHEPLTVPAGSAVLVKIWRRTEAYRVWYEWCATVLRDGEVLGCTPIHNPNGRSSFVSM